MKHHREYCSDSSEDEGRSDGELIAHGKSKGHHRHRRDKSESSESDQYSSIAATFFKWTFNVYTLKRNLGTLERRNLGTLEIRYFDLLFEACVQFILYTSDHCRENWGWLDNRGTGDMGSRGRGRNTGRKMNLHQTLTPQVHHDIVGTPESIDKKPSMAVIDMKPKPPGTGKTLVMENDKLCERQRTRNQHVIT